MLSYSQCPITLKLNEVAMNNYLFLIGILLIALGLFVKFKFQIKQKIGSDNFKKNRSLSYALLGMGITSICFYFILERYNTFPELKKCFEILLAGTIYVYVCWVLPFKIQRKINKIYKKEDKFGFVTPKEYFCYIYIGITTGIPILIAILYVLFKFFNIFPEFAFTVDQFLDLILHKSTNPFIFLIYGFIFIPVAFAFVNGSIYGFILLSALYAWPWCYFWEKRIESMSESVGAIYFIVAILTYIVICFWAFREIFQ